MFSALAAAGVQEATGVGPVETVLHSCVPDGTQTAEPVGAVQPQVVAVQGGVVVALAGTGVQDDTPMGPVVTTGQVVATQLLVEVAAAGVHEPVGVGPTTVLPQVVAV